LYPYIGDGISVVVDEDEHRLAVAALHNRGLREIPLLERADPRFSASRAIKTILAVGMPPFVECLSFGNRYPQNVSDFDAHFGTPFARFHSTSAASSEARVIFSAGLPQPAFAHDTE
jgi:hypothetical protein